MQDVHNLIHDWTGLNVYRNRIKIRKDAFYEYLPKEDDKHREIFHRLGDTIADLSNICFKRCADPHYKYFTYEEEACVRKCARQYFAGFQQLVRAANEEIGENI